MQVAKDNLRKLSIYQTCKRVIFPNFVHPFRLKQVSTRQASRHKRNFNCNVTSEALAWSSIVFTSLRDGNRPHRIVGQPLVTANDVGHWDQKHPKVLIVGEKKNAKNLIAMYSGPTQFKKQRKTWKNGEIAVIYSVFARWEAETTADTMVFEGQVAKNTVIYSVNLQCFFNQRQKTLVFTMFSFTP